MIYYPQFLDCFRSTVSFLCTMYQVAFGFSFFQALAVSLLAGDRAGSGYVGSWHKARQEMVLLSLLLQKGCQCVNFCSQGLASAQKGGGGGEGGVHSSVKSIEGSLILFAHTASLFFCLFPENIKRSWISKILTWKIINLIFFSGVEVHRFGTTVVKGSGMIELMIVV